MKDFQFLDYNTEYSCTGSFNKSMSSEACFMYAFRRLTNDSISERYKVILYKGTILSKDSQEANACIFNIRQVRNHLKQAQGIYPFKYRVTEAKHKGFDVFEVHLNLIDVPGLFHKYLLTWLRYMYEYPYNVILYDAYKLKEKQCFRYASISNLFNLVLSCFFDDVRIIHQIPRIGVCKRMCKKDIRNKLTYIERLNNLYDYFYTHRIREIPENIQKFNITDIEYWITDGLFEKYREPIYMDVYKQTLR